MRKLKTITILALAGTSVLLTAQAATAQMTTEFAPPPGAIASSPVPDTPANRAKYPPLSHAGWASAPDGD
jgi:hypothetical protein